MMPPPSTGNSLSLITKIMIHFCFLPFSASTIESCFSDTDCVAGTYCFHAKDNPSSGVCKSCLDCSSNETDCENDSKCQDCSNDGYYMDTDGICTFHNLAETSTNTLAPSTYYDIRKINTGTIFKWIISVAVCIALGLLAYMGVNKYRNRGLRGPYQRMQARQSTPGGRSNSQSNSIPQPSSVTVSDESNKEATAATGRIIEGNLGEIPGEREPVNETANNNNMMLNFLRRAINTNTVPISTNSILTLDLPAQSSQVEIISQTIPHTFGVQPSLPSEEISMNLMGQQLSSLVSHQERPRPVFGISLGQQNSLDSWAADTSLDPLRNSQLNARSLTTYRGMENDGNRQVPEVEIEDYENEDPFYEENEDH